MKIPKSTQPRGSRVQPGKSPDVDSLEERWLRRWQNWLEKHGADSRWGKCFKTYESNPTGKLRRQAKLVDGIDFAWDFSFGIYPGEAKVCIEIQGGQHMTKSGHTNAGGQNRDALKTRLAAERGFRVMTWTTDDIAKDRGFDQLGRALGIIVGGD